MSDSKPDKPIKTLADKLREAETRNSPRLSIRSEVTSIYKERLEFSPKEKWRILKNVGMTSLAFTFLHTAFQGMMNIQSSINPEHGLGTIALSVIFLTQMLSCLFLPNYVIDKLTVKWTIVFTIGSFAPYIAAQFYPRFSTLLPAAVLAGIGAGPMWSAHSTYITQLAQVYSKIVNQNTDAVIVRFFGIFFFVFQTQDLWGNLISSVVFLTDDQDKPDTTRYLNPLLLSVNPVEEEITYCGAAFCGFTEGEGDIDQSRTQVNIITAIYLTSVIMSVIVAFFFLDPLTRYGEKLAKDQDADRPSSFELVMATLNQLKKPKQQLLVFLTIFTGMEQAFSATEYTQAFITCSLGVGQIGFIMISFGICNCTAAMTFGYLVGIIGRIPVFTFGIIGHSCLLVWTMIWEPNPNNVYMFYIYACLWGVFDGIWQTQVNGLYGSMFKGNKEAAFSNYRLFEAMGFALSLGTSTLFCLRTKAMILLIIFLLGALGYAIVEFREKRKEKQLNKMETSSIDDQRRAQLMRMQSQSFDPLEEVVDVVEDDDSDSKRSSAASQPRFRRSVAFFIGSDVLKEKEVGSARRVTIQNNFRTNNV